MIILMLVSVIAIACLAGCALYAATGNSGGELKKLILIGVFSISVFFGTFAWSNNADEYWNSQAEKFIPLYENSCFSTCDYIYREVDTGKYFRIEDNKWNPIKPTYRVYLDTETVEKYIEAYNIVTTQKLSEE